MDSLRIAALMLLLCAAAPARADIYGYVDDEGEVHLANHPTSDRFEAWAVAPKPEPAAVKLPAPEPGPREPALAQLRGRYDAMVREAAAAVELEPALVHAVVSVESGYNPRAVSRKGASGLMQLMPHTARRYGVADIFDPAQNLRAGARYLRDLLRLFDNDLKLALAAYNAGEKTVARHGKIPPFRETLAYVPKVLSFYRQLGAGAS